MPDIRPRDVSGLDLAFPTNVDHLLPAYNEIPDTFKRGWNPWTKLVSHWFFAGLKGAKFTPKAGIDQSKALRHVKVCMGSWEPKHEHKEAGCAYLLSLWFDRIEADGISASHEKARA